MACSPKIEPIRSKKLRDASNGRSCSRCKRCDGTTVRCHYTGIRQHQYGKGRGIKGHDLVAADLCTGCHSYFDQYENRLGNDKIYRQIEASEEFLHCCMLTLIADFREGIIK